MDFAIQGSRPIWQQLTEQLARRIITGAYPLGARFPAVRELAAEAGVNPNTMQRAITQLETLGLVTTNRTLGRTVTENAEALEEMRRRLANAMGIDAAQVSVKATTEEHLGFTGAGEGMACHAVALLGKM